MIMRPLATLSVTAAVRKGEPLKIGVAVNSRARASGGMAARVSDILQSLYGWRTIADATGIHAD